LPVDAVARADAQSLFGRYAAPVADKGDLRAHHALPQPDGLEHQQCYGATIILFSAKNLHNPKICCTFAPKFNMLIPSVARQSTESRPTTDRKSTFNRPQMDCQWIKTL